MSWCTLVALIALGRATYAGAQDDAKQTAVPGAPPPPVQLPPVPGSWAAVAAPPESDLRCLRLQEQGCSEIRNEAVCKWSRDGRRESPWPGIDITGSPCVWCGDGQCTGNSTSMCEPLAYLKEGEGKQFPIFLQPGNFYVATCAGRTPLPDLNYECLLWEKDGCAWITDGDLCLRSRDGRADVRYLGRGPYGDPCVWCGGGVCTDGDDDKCKPLDYLLNGRGTLYRTWHVPASARFGACTEDGRVRSLSIGLFPDYQVAFTNKDLPAEVMPQQNLSGVVAAPGAGSEGRLRCGGKNWNRYAKCADGTICNVTDSSDFYYCSEPGQGPPHGRFVSAGNQVWWQSPVDGSKELVKPGTDCSRCGCNGTSVPLAQGLIDEMPSGPDYDCGLHQDTPTPPGLPAVADNPAGSGNPVVGPSEPGSGAAGSREGAGGGGGATAAPTGGDVAGQAEASDPESRRPASSWATLALGLLLTLCFVCGGCGLGLWNARHSKALCPGEEQSPRSVRDPSRSWKAALADGSRPRGVALEEGQVVQDRGLKGAGPAPLPQTSAVFAPRTTATPTGVYRLLPGRVAQPAFIRVAAAPMAGSLLGSTRTAEGDASSGNYSVFDAIDVNHDGQITREEWERYAFQAFDRNHDGQVSADEWREGLRNP